MLLLRHSAVLNCSSSAKPLLRKRRPAYQHVPKSRQEDLCGTASITVNVSRTLAVQMWLVVKKSLRTKRSRHLEMHRARCPRDAFAPCNSCVAEVSRLRQGLRENLKAPVRNVCNALRVGKKMTSVLEDLIC